MCIRDSYCAVDGLALSDETITATVAEVTVEWVALLCTGSDAMRIGDKVKVLTRPAYIYNILPTEDATKCILVGQLCGDDTTAATAYPGSVAAGHPVTLITGVRTEAASSLRANATPDTAQRLPVATAATIGGVIAAAKTASQTEEVGIDAAGKLWTAPAAGATGDLAYDNASSGLTAQTVQGAIDELAAKIIIVANPESWAGVQSLIRAGWAQKVFAIGDQLECNHKTYGKLVWDVIGFDMDAMSIGAHSMTLQLHSLINETIVFDAAEAVYYAETGLDAGTYYITIAGQDWYPADNGVPYQFTLTQPLPAGGQLVLSATATSSLAGQSIISYADNTTYTAIETAVLTQGAGGVDLGITDGAGNVNHIQGAL